MNPVPRLRSVLLFCTAALCSVVAVACNESISGIESMAPETIDAIPVLHVLTPQNFTTTIVDPTLFPIRVRVTDPQGRPLPSVSVHYNVVAGSGAFSATTSLTDDQGFTQVLFRPTSLGTVIAEARVELPNGTTKEQFRFQVLDDPTLPDEFRKVSGDGQVGEVGTLLPEPFVVRILNPNGGPVEDFPVTFAIESPDSVSAMVNPATGVEAHQVTVRTDELGFAKAFLRLGSTPRTFTAKATALFGRGESQTVQSATFNSVAVLANNAAVRLVAVSGERQTVILGTADSTDPTSFTPFAEPEEPNPLVVQALDRFGNPVAGVRVFWHVTDGGGKLQSEVTLTDSEGFTVNVLREPTLGRNLVDAVAATTNRVTFVIEGVSTGEAEEERPGPGESGPSKGG